jgi:hypothetical protein
VLKLADQSGGLGWTIGAPQEGCCLKTVCSWSHCWPARASRSPPALRSRVSHSKETYSLDHDRFELRLIPPALLCKLCAMSYLNIGSDTGSPFGTIAVWYPKITSSSFAGVGKDMRMKIRGCGFRRRRLVYQVQRNLQYSRYVDWSLASATWQAGYTSRSDFTNSVMLKYLSRSLSNVEISSFGSEYGKGPAKSGRRKMTANNPVEIAVANTRSCNLDVVWQPSPTFPLPQCLYGEATWHRRLRRICVAAILSNRS